MLFVSASWGPFHCIACSPAKAQKLQVQARLCVSRVSLSVQPHPLHLNASFFELAQLLCCGCRSWTSCSSSAGARRTTLTLGLCSHPTIGSWSLSYKLRKPCLLQARLRSFLFVGRVVVAVVLVRLPVFGLHCDQNAALFSE